MLALSVEWQKIDFKSLIAFDFGKGLKLPALRGDDYCGSVEQRKVETPLLFSKHVLCRKCKLAQARSQPLN